MQSTHRDFFGRGFGVVSGLTILVGCREQRPAGLSGMRLPLFVSVASGVGLSEMRHVRRTRAWRWLRWPRHHHLHWASEELENLIESEGSMSLRGERD